VSPVFADLTKLPPILLQVSNKEQLYNDSVTLAQKAKQSGVQVTFEVYEDAPHVFQIVGHTLLDCAKEAVDNIGKYVIQKVQEVATLAPPPPDIQRAKL
jgi:acetyl esterase/lipase